MLSLTRFPCCAGRWGLVAFSSWWLLACGAVTPPLESPDSTPSVPESPPAVAEPAENADAAAVLDEPLASAANGADDMVFLVPEALPEGMSILHIGDSFAGVLGRPLHRELARRGLRSFLEYQTGTYIATWASTKPVSRYIRRYRPDLVLITLGANELDVARPERKARSVQKLVRSLGGRPCIWIAPPLWEGAKSEVLGVIQDNCAPCTYLDSTTLVPDLERRDDAIHPSPAGGARWASAVIDWLEQHPPLEAEQRWVQLEP